MKQNQANILLEKHMRELHLEFDCEFKFHAQRRWRADYRITNKLRNGSMVLIEIEGSVYTQGRHTRGKGYEDDMRKYNAAQAMGYFTWRFSTNMVLRGEARSFLQEHLKP